MRPVLLILSLLLLTASIHAAVTNVDTNAYYNIVSKYSGKLLDVSGVSTDNGANIHQWSSWKGDNQQWMFQDAGNGYYFIKAKHSGKVIDVSGPSTDNGANIHQWSFHGGFNQQWRLQDAGDGYVYLVARHSDKVLDVAQASLENGGNIHQWALHGGPNQHWKLERIAPPVSVTASQLIGTYFAIYAKNVGNASVVHFPIWTEANGQDDIRWEQGVYDAVNDRWVAQINIVDHNSESGNYITHVYATDTQGQRFVGAITVVVAEDQASTSITSPAANALFRAGDTVSVRANAVDRDGIEVVRLWVDGAYHSLDNSAPFEFSVSDLPPGTHSLMVRSKDALGNLLDSAPVSITIAAPTPPPSVTASEQMVSGTYFEIYASNVGSASIVQFPIWTEANGQDDIRWVQGVYDAANNRWVARINIADHNAESGNYITHVYATDAQGQRFVGAITVRVAGDQPSVSITSPAANALFSAGATLSVRANAVDRDGIEVVRLWVNGVYHSLDNSAPFEFSVSDLPSGTHSLMVRSKDALGNLLDSAPVSITIAASRPFPSPAPTTGSIQLPIEVLGPAGTQKSVRFELNDPSSVSHLYLRCNACGYDDISLNKNSQRIKATVRINGGSPIALKHFTENGQIYGNAQIRIIGGEGLYGGIGGSFRTVRFTVPVNGLRRGVNTLTFEHLNAEAPSIGFRIIELNLLQNGDTSRTVLNAADFTEDDPSDWIAPRTSSTDIARGEALWHQRNKLYDLSYDLTDGQGNGLGSINGQMRASCSDCHAQDGRDLKYFNFSNTSIIERAKFHRLSQAEAEQIASYIRDLDIPVVDQARPWNPAYQPGAGLDSLPAYEWAAGAGVDAILDRDSDMASFLFPSGTSQGDVRAVVDRYDTLNLRELPINIPLPEWNQWLPLIHPDDAFNTSAAAINQDSRGRNVGMPFYLSMYNDARDNPTPDNLGGLSRDLKAWLRRGMTCQSNGPGSGEPYRGLNGSVLTSLRMPSPTVTSSNCASFDRSRLGNIELAKRGLTAWATVKLWEINHTQELEERSQNVGRSICSGSRCINASEARGWQAEGRNVFDRPPHFTTVERDRKYLSQNEMQGIFESNSWYHLNMVLNPGYRVTMPSHFAYTYSHIELLQQYAGVSQGYRFWATLIKQRQLQTNGRYGIEEGLDMRTAQPYIYFGTARGRTSTATQSSVGQPLWGRLVTAMIEDFTGDANNASAQDWERASRNSDVQDRNSSNFSPCNGACVFDLGPYQGRNTYRVIPELRRIGVQESSIQGLIDWGQKTWPRGPWSRVR